MLGSGRFHSSLGNLRCFIPPAMYVRFVLEGKPESDDEKLLGQFYTQLKGAAKGNGYTGIPRFYAKVSTHQCTAA